MKVIYEKAIEVNKDLKLLVDDQQYDVKHLKSQFDIGDKDEVKKITADRNSIKTFRIRETPNPSTNVDRSKKKSLFLRIYKLVHKCTSQPIKHLPRMDLAQLQSGTTHCVRYISRCNDIGRYRSF